MRRAIFIVLVAAATLVGSVVYAAAPSHAPAWAAQFLSRWYAHYNSGDASALANMFTLDARFGSERGRSAIAASMADDFSKTQYRCSGSYDGVRELGDLAVAWGHESCLETSKADKKTTRTHERWLLVFRRQADGAWLLSDETFSAAIASGAVS